MIEPKIITGPCSFESKEYTFKTIDFLTKKGIINIRGGANKYRSNKNDYQGQEEVFNWIRELKKTHNFNYFCEIFDFDTYLKNKDIINVIQIGSRNMHNTDLLKKINKTERPVLLKRHYASSLNEFVNHSKYLENCDVIMCLRGILSLFPQEQRFFHDLTDIARLKELTKNKICYDVSHSSCDKKYIKNAFNAARVYNPDYIMVEVHPEPNNALSDVKQQLNFNEFNSLIKKKGNDE